MGRWIGVDGSTSYVVEKLRAVEREIGAGEWKSFALQKSKEFAAVLEHSNKMFIAKVDEISRSGTRLEQPKQWAQVAASYIIVGTALWILFRCCCRGGRGGLFWILFRCCCGGGRGGQPKMMIAPGTNRALKIPRSSFEASPRSYFRGLRGK